MEEIKIRTRPRRVKSIKKLENSLNFVGWVIVFGLIGLTFVIIHNIANKPSTPKTAEEISESRKYMAFRIAENIVRKNLKAPSTAKFGSITWDSDDCYVLDNKDGTFKVIGYVDAQNSFGAMIRTEYHCTLSVDKNDNWDLVSIELY